MFVNPKSQPTDRLKPCPCLKQQALPDQTDHDIAVMEVLTCLQIICDRITEGKFVDPGMQMIQRTIKETINEVHRE